MRGYEANHRSKKSPSHVGLCVPNITLSAEEGIGIFPNQQSCPPLDQLIKGTECKADRKDDKISPTIGIHYFFS